MPSAPLRELVASTALRLGPEAPTLCSPWTVQDLLAHLVARESRPDVLPGLGARSGRLADHTASVQRDLARGSTLPELAEQVRTGPPRWWPTRLRVLDDAVNTAELAIHHEDMVRAQEGWEPTALPPDVEAALWRTLRTGGRLFYRSAPVGVVVVAEGHGRASLRRPPAEAGTVVVRGRPLELLLHAFGRTDVARVVEEGDPADLASLAASPRAA
ncbi:TIGR03085 family metal-binding protein [Ornithinimicrobium cerasi]|uniref:TIGR03085 family metal-binding protein n=1 Tax=Ornithinimicrobium cerasi TaxID=2248773 RepID=UPI000EFFD8FE|nr:TIGR03085 family metal-binding protein [Ornithinimicrobium cerasi]